MSDAKPKILIVDDDTDLLELLTMRLTAAGYKVDAVPSAEAALNYLDVSRPQLVISDMQMSGMDGMALFEQIHRTLPTLPVIILTAHGTIPDAVTAVQRGVFGYLAKPFDSKTLLANISQALKFVPGAVSQKELSQAPWRKNIITHRGSNLIRSEREKEDRQQNLYRLVQSFLFSDLCLLEDGWIELVSLQQLVELRPITLGEACCLGNVSSRDFKYAHQIIPFKTSARILERHELLFFPVHRIVDQHRRDKGCSTQGNASLDDVHELAHIAGPGCGNQCFHCLGRKTVDIFLVFL